MMTTATETVSNTTAQTAFKKILHPADENVSNNLERTHFVPVFLKVEYSADGRLSITGVAGPRNDGNCAGSCGQINIGIVVDELRPTSDWTRKKLQQLFDVWERWHLNDMRAGSPVQENYLREHPIPPKDYAYPKSYYDVAGKVLADAGLNPDVDGYLYGHALKREEVPTEVLDFLRSLPDTDKTPAWV